MTMESPGAGVAVDDRPAGVDGGGDDEAGAAAGGLRALSRPARITVGLVMAAVALTAAVHLLMVFLYVAPPNTVSQANRDTVNGYVLPEFEQNWKLFAPNPVQENTDVEARAEVRRPDGSLAATGWVDLTAMDDTHVLHNPFPSHVNQNELRRAWDFYTGSHDAQEHTTGSRGELSQDYLRRIVAHRFGPHLNGGTVELVQVRSVTQAVAAPPWSSDKTDTRPTYRVLPWWAVSSEDFQ